MTSLDTTSRDIALGALRGLLVGLVAVALAVGAVLLFSFVGMGIIGGPTGEFRDPITWAGAAVVGLALVVAWFAGFLATRRGGHRAGLVATLALVAIAWIVLAILNDPAAALVVLGYTSPLPLAMLAGSLMSRRKARTAGETPAAGDTAIPEGDRASDA